MSKLLDDLQQISQVPIPKKHSMTSYQKCFLEWYDDCKKALQEEYLAESNFSSYYLEDSMACDFFNSAASILQNEKTQFFIEECFEVIPNEPLYSPIAGYFISAALKHLSASKLVIPAGTLCLDGIGRGIYKHPIEIFNYSKLLSTCLYGSNLILENHGTIDELGTNTDGGFFRNYGSILEYYGEKNYMINLGSIENVFIHNSTLLNKGQYQLRKDFSNYGPLTVIDFSDKTMKQFSIKNNVSGYDKDRMVEYILQTQYFFISEVALQSLEKLCTIENFSHVLKAEWNVTEGCDLSEILITSGEAKVLHSDEELI